MLEILSQHPRWEPRFEDEVSLMVYLEVEKGNEELLQPKNILGRPLPSLRLSILEKTIKQRVWGQLRFHIVWLIP